MTEAARDLEFQQAAKRFVDLACEAAAAYFVPLEQLLDGGNHKDRQMSAAKVGILKRLDSEFQLSNPQLAILFGFNTHATIILMRRRLRGVFPETSGPTHRARRKLNAAVHAGRIQPPKECSSCGKTQLCRLDGHHHKGYAARYALDVVWLCRSCHGQLHRKERQAR